MGSSTAYWYVKDQIVFVHNVGDLTADDFRAVDKQIIAFMQETHELDPNRKIHVLVDCTDMRGLPKLTELEGGRILKYMRESNCGLTTVVGYRHNLFLKVLSQLLTSIMGVDLYLAETLPKAINIFHQIAPELDALPDIEAWKQHTLAATNR